MRRSEVAQLDLRLEPSDLSALRHPQIQRPLLLALVCGAMFGLWVVREIEADRQRLAQTQTPLKAELASLQSTQREHDLQLKALQELQTQWQQHGLTAQGYWAQVQPDAVCWPMQLQRCR